MLLPRAIILAVSVTPCAAQTLVAHYKLDETMGTVCADSSGNGLDGTYRNSFTLGQGAPAASCGTAVDFDAAGMTDVIIPGAPPLQGLVVDLTVSAWFNADDLPGANSARRVFGNNNGGWMCGLHGDGLIFTTRFIQDYIVSGLGMNAQTWTHVAFVFDSNGVTFYLDGQNVGFVPGGAPANAPNPEWFIGGFDGNIEFWDGLLDDVQVYSGTLSASDIADLYNNPCGGGGGDIGTPYCGPAALNSTGQPGVISAFGSEMVALNDVRLDAAQLALNQNSYFITSMTQGFVMPPGSQGFLCMGGTIGRFNANVLNTGGAGEVSLQIDLTNIPIGAGVAVQPGESWYFQLWYRDVNPMATSNFTDGVCITFQ